MDNIKRPKENYICLTNYLLYPSIYTKNFAMFVYKFNVSCLNYTPEAQINENKKSNGVFHKSKIYNFMIGINTFFLNPGIWFSFSRLICFSKCRLLLSGACPFSGKVE